MSEPLVSIITPVYNSASFIEESILSVLRQTYPHIEYIIMDGGSTDGTVEIAHKYEAYLTIISEKDDGQSNAINKGWRISKGDILAWLNADDLYLPDTVEKAVDYLQAHPNVDWVYGQAQFVTAGGEPAYFRYPTFEWNYEQLIEFGCYISQPTVFLRRKVLDRFGYIDESLNYGMDYEYWLRIGKETKVAFVPNIQAVVKIFRETKSRSGSYKRIQELESIVKRYGATELPITMRHQWIESVLDLLVQDLRTKNLKAFSKDLKKLWRYPHYIRYGILKWLVKNLIPSPLEDLIRKLFLFRS